MTYEVFLACRLRKSLDRLDAETRKKIVERLRLLSDNPFAYHTGRSRAETRRTALGSAITGSFTPPGNEVRVLGIDKRERVYDRI